MRGIVVVGYSTAADRANYVGEKSIQHGVCFDVDHLNKLVDEVTQVGQSFRYIRFKVYDKPNKSIDTVKLAEDYLKGVYNP